MQNKGNHENEYMKNDLFTYKEWSKKNIEFLNDYLETIDEKKLIIFPSHSFHEQFYFWLFKVKNEKLAFYNEPWYTGAIQLEPNRYLTKWGQKNIESVLKHYEQWWNTNFINRYDYFSQFYDVENNEPFDLKYYQKKYIKNEWDFSQASGGLKYCFDWFMNQVTRMHTKLIMRDCENSCRTELGIPKVGEGWVSETALYYYVKTLLPEFEVIHHGQPKFLRLQHYDIYIPELLIAIEYQGVQHQKPIEYFGGKEAFFQNKERDKRKVKLSKENGVQLIQVFPDYDEKKLTSKIKRTITMQIKKLQNK